MMRSLLVVLLSLGISSVAFAEEITARSVDGAGAVDDTQALADQTEEAGVSTGSLLEGDVALGFFGGPIMRLTSASGNIGWMLGLRGGAVFNEKITLGLAGFLSVADPDLITDTPYPNPRTITFGYFGPEVGYIYHASDTFHARARVLAGFGRIGHNGTSSDPYVGTDNFFVGEPGLDFVARLHEMVELSFGVGYRFGYDIQLEGFKLNSDNRVTTANGLNIDFAVEANVL